MEFLVYILYSDRINQYYVGQTKDLNGRLLRHNAGHGKHTKKGIPWSLIWSTAVETRSTAMGLEKEIKKRGADRYLRDHNIIE